jgi:tRNA A37 methylthiotransferase MiaB
MGDDVLEGDSKIQMSGQKIHLPLQSGDDHILEALKQEAYPRGLHENNTVHKALSHKMPQYSLI